MRGFKLLFPLLTLISAQYTDPGLLPGFSTFQGCVTVLFSDTGEELLNDIGCGDWYCACDHYSDAIYTLSTMAVSQCTTVAQDVIAATSLFNSFCLQLSAIPPASTTFSPAGLTNPFQWPGFSTLRSCVQDLFGEGEELLNDVNCANWFCVCDDSGASFTLSTLAASQCTDAQDIAAATSVLDAFCDQISLTALVPTAATGNVATDSTPTITGNQGTGPAATG
jgi:hypothetical protein